MPDFRHSEEFVRELTGSQEALFAFILSLLPVEDAARDVLQDANVVLWRKADQFTPGTSFIAWACQVARLEVLAYYKRSGRERLLFDNDLVDHLVDEATERAAESQEQVRAFEQCVRKLSEHQRQLLVERYTPGGSVTAMARQRDQSPSAMSVTLSRIRRALRECVANRLRSGEAP